MHDSHKRSVVKGMSWRLIGSIDTAVLSYVFTKDTGHALQIAGAEMVTKIGLFYLHERVWLRLDIGRKRVQLANGGFAFVETHWRSIFKGITWRITGTLDTIFWAAVITGKTSTALKIGLAELITKIILYYLHERGWMCISWGRRPHNLIPEPTSAGSS
jgi:uncharacterized membrane protein